MDLKDWHKRLDLEAKHTKRAQDRAATPPKPLPAQQEAAPDASALESLPDGGEAVGGRPGPPRKGRGPRKEESREELLSRLLNPDLTLEETARLLRVCPTTVRRWTNKGVLPHERTGGNQRRFKLFVVLDFINSRQRAAPAGEGGEE